MLTLVRGVSSRVLSCSKAECSVVTRSLASHAGDQPDSQEEVLAATHKWFRDIGGGEVKLSKNDPTGVAIVTISNPERSNALSGKMMADLYDIVDDLSKWENGKAVIITGQGSRAFCSGADLSVIIKKGGLSANAAGVAMCKYMHHTLRSFHALPLLSVAAINGAAVGGGSELSTACDFRLLHGPNAKIQFVHARMGVTPGWGGAMRLTKIVGRRHALRLLCTAQPISGQDAMDIGLVDAVDDGTTGASAVESALLFLEDFILNQDPIVCRALKTVVSTADDGGSVDALLEHERDVFGTMWGGPANRRALSSHNMVQAVRRKFMDGMDSK